MSKDGNGTEETKKRLKKATCRGTLAKCWNTRGIEKKTKLNLFKMLFSSVLLYGCKTYMYNLCHNTPFYSCVLSCQAFEQE